MKHIYWERLNLDQKSISDPCFFPLSSNQTAVASWAPELGKTGASGAWWKHMELPEHLTAASEKKRWSKLTAGRYALKTLSTIRKEEKVLSLETEDFLAPPQSFFSLFLYKHRLPCAP